jgi:hypothetical protein
MRMLIARLVGIVGLVVIVAAMAVAPRDAALAGEPGVSEVRRATVRQIVFDTGAPWAPECLRGVRSHASPSWVLVLQRSLRPAPCGPGVGSWVVTKTRTGQWAETDIRIGVAGIDCRSFKVDLARNKASVLVFRDFRAAGACSHG